MGKKWHLISAEILKKETVCFSLFYANKHTFLEKHMYLPAHIPSHVILEAWLALTSKLENTFWFYFDGLFKWN